MPVDLSTLSDDQLDAYKSLLQSNQPQYTPPMASIDRETYDNGGHAPGFFDKGGTVDRVIQGTGLSNIPHDLSESASSFMENPTLGNIPVVGPSLSAAGRLLTMRSQSPMRDAVSSVPVVGPAAVQVGDNLAAGQYPEAFGGAVALLSPMAHDAVLPESIQRAGSVAAGAVKGGSRAAVTPIEYGMHKLPIPASLAGGAAGHFAGSVFGPIGSTVGTVVGAASPFVKGAIEGGSRAGGLFDVYHTPDAPARPAFRGQDFTPPSFDRSAPVGQPGAVLPSGSIVGPAAPSRINPPEPRGNPPRVSQTVRMGIPTAEGPGPPPDLSPIYPASPVLPSGISFGPRPSGEPNPGTVINGGQSSVPIASPAPPASVSAPVVQPSSVIRIGQTPGERITALSQSPEGTVGTRAEMMRQLRLANQSGADAPSMAAIIRRFEAPEYTPRPDRPFVDPMESKIITPSEPIDTPATYRASVNQSRAKFDASGKRNQLK